MKSLTESINEGLNGVILSESLTDNISNFYNRVLRRRSNITDFKNLIREVLTSEYPNFEVMIKKAGDVVSDRKCATLNTKNPDIFIRKTFHHANDIPGDLWSTLLEDPLGSRLGFEEYYEDNPDQNLLCIYDKDDGVYSLCDLLYFLGSDWLESKFLNKDHVRAAVEHCIREIAYFKNPRSINMHNDVVER